MFGRYKMYFIFSYLAFINVSSIKKPVLLIKFSVVSESTGDRNLHIK